MGSVQALEQIHDDANPDVQRHALPGEGEVTDDRVQGVPFHQLHHQEQTVGAAVDVDGADHVRVADASRQAGLVQEHGDEFLIVRDVRMHQLDRDQTLEAAFATDPAQIDRRHAPFRNRAQQLVAAELPSHARQDSGPLDARPTGGGSARKSVVSRVLARFVLPWKLSACASET